MTNKTKNISVLLFILIISSVLVSAYNENPIQDKVHKDLWKLIDEESKPKFVIQSISSISQKKVDVLVQLNNETDLEDVGNKIKSKGGDVKGKYKLGNVVTAKVPVNKIVDISKNKKIKSIWPNQQYHLMLNESVPQINAPFMWNSGYNGSGVKIAVIDTGIDSSHPDFQGRIILQNDFVPSSYVVDEKEYGDGDDDSIAQDTHGHGTHCAGIAAGAGNEFKGVAPAAYLMAAKVFGASNAFDGWIIAAINWAADPDGDNSTDDSADIISMSLGHAGNSDGPLNQAIRDAIAKGIVVVIASGNDGYNVPNVPSNTKEAVAVGAVNKNSQWAAFSSGYDYGGYLKPDIVAPGVNIIAARASGTSMGSVIDDYYTSSSGTSMATPHIAGATALLLQSNLNLTPEAVKYILEKTAIPLGEPGKDIRYGSGLIDISQFIPGNVNKLLKYRLNFPEFVYKGVAVNIEINATMDSLIESITADITGPDYSVYGLTFVNTTANSWQAQFSNTDLLGKYDLNISINEKQGNTTEFDETFDVVRYNLTQGVINDLVFAGEVGYNETVAVMVEFENTGNSTLNVTVEVQLIDSNSNLINSEESNETPVVENYTFHLSLGANGFPGNYQVKAIASFEGDYHTKEKPLYIVDNSAPAVQNVSFMSSIVQNENLLAQIKIYDLSNLSGIMHVEKPSGNNELVQLMPVAETADIKTMAGTFYNTSEIGSYSFYLEICDVVGLCTISGTYGFQVEACDKPLILVVEENSWENASKKYVDNFNDDYCLSIWKKDKSGTPPLGYLNRFYGVIWSTGNYWGCNVDDDGADLLDAYISGHGKLVLEGPDIALNHDFDYFMENVTHSVFKNDIEFLDDTGISNISVDYPHLIFRGLSETLEFNSSLCPYPDSVEPFNRGISMASWGWQINGSSVIGFNSGNSKTLFFPFMIDAIAHADYRDTIVRNIGEWLTIDNKRADLIVVNISHDYLIQGVNSFNVTIINNGNESANNVLLSVYVDGTFDSQSYVSINSGEEIRVNSVVNLSSGHHELKIMVNRDLNITETNYLNNFMEKSIWVAAIEPDLVLENLYFTAGSNVIAEISNMGGTGVGSADVGFYINDILNETKYIFLNFNEKINATFAGPSQKGIFDVKVLINANETIVESNYTNNNISSKLYLCSRSHVLIIADDDVESYSTNSPGSADEFETILKENDHCTFVWKESERGVPSVDVLNNYDVIIWSSGDYWGTAVNESDVALLNQYNGNILFEGADIGFDHDNDNFIRNSLHSVLDKDLILNQTTEIIFDSTMLGNIASIAINDTLCLYPDSVIALNATAVANWSHAKSAIIAYNDSDLRMVYFAFSVDAITDIDKKEELILNAVEWLDTKKRLEIKLVQGWNLISVPLILENNSVENIFKAINYSKIFSYDSKWRVPTVINDTMGLWIKAGNDEIFTVKGLRAQNTLINLNKGWNLIGYLILNESNVSYVFEDVNDSLINVLTYENGEWKSYNPLKNDQLNNLKIMKPGFGYWVEVNDTLTLEFS